jgi:hypothetical protein
MWFPTGNSQDARAATREAQAICHTCPVRLQCGNTALERREQWGVWGGMTERQRRAILRRRAELTRKPVTSTPKAKPKKRQPAECGTRGGYQKHLREKTEICGPCRQANADADNRLRRTGTSKVAA